MKKIIGAIGVLVLFLGCNKNDNTDYFCAAVESEDWTTVSSYFSSDASDRGHEHWEQNAAEFARIVSDRNCVDTAYATGFYLETVPETTEIIVLFDVNQDSLPVKKSVILEIDESTGDITFRGLL